MLKNIIKDLYPMGATLLGVGYNNALEYINKLIDLDITEIKSGTEMETWTVPDEWIVKDAWVKFNGKKIIDYKKDPLSLTVYSQPFKGKLSKKEFMKYLYCSVERPDALSYEYAFYEKKWGFSMPKNKVYKKVPKPKTCDVGLKAIDPTIGGVTIQGQDKYKDVLKEGKYEVFIDTEFKQGIMKIGVHTIKGKTDKEILLFAHLDHPYQANDNLSGVACLIDMVKRIKKAKFEHTIKLVFCPETIGSIGYVMTQDLSNVDFMIAIDCVGNDGDLLVQKAFDKFDRINYAVHFAAREQGITYKKGEFRHIIGSDEYMFNDPKVDIPGIMISRWPYDEYHTSDDTPDKIDIKKIKEVQEVILKTIKIYEKDYVPVRNFEGPLMRIKYGIQSVDKRMNRALDYLFYDMDNKKYLSDLCLPLELDFGDTYEKLEKLVKKGLITKKKK